MAGSEAAHAGWAALNVTDKENSFSQDTYSCLCVCVPVCVCGRKRREDKEMRGSEGSGMRETAGS